MTAPVDEKPTVKLERIDSNAGIVFQSIKHDSADKVLVVVASLIVLKTVSSEGSSTRAFRPLANFGGIDLFNEISR